MEADHAFTTFNTEKEVAQAIRNTFVKKVRSPCAALHQICKFSCCVRPLPVCHMHGRPPFSAGHHHRLTAVAVMSDARARSTMACGTASLAATLALT